MRAVLCCIALFMAILFLFSCSQETGFDKSEDFESGKLSDTFLKPRGTGTFVWIVSSPDRVINGNFSAYSIAGPNQGEWWHFIYSDRKKLPLERNGSYTVTFKYKAVEKPKDDGFYYFVVRTDTGFDRDKSFANDRAFTKWVDAAGAVGTKRVNFTLGDFDDYYLIWGVHKQGALAIDDIEVKKSN